MLAKAVEVVLTRLSLYGMRKNGMLEKKVEYAVTCFLREREVWLDWIMTSP
jgi:hypothetical protein